MADNVPNPRSPGSKWHGEKSDPLLRRPTSHRGRQLFWLTALALAILGTVVAILLYPHAMVPPRFLPMTVREYQSPLFPPNAWALQDGQRLASHFEKKDDLYDKQNRDQFDKFLTRIETYADGPLVVQLCALGRVYDGQVVLFLGDSDPDQPGRAMPLKRVLEHMKGKTPGDRLLLLDLARPIADVRLGILANDLAAAVQAELEAAELPFFVLTSCSSGQMSHVSEELGASLFAYYLDIGLRGYADQSRDQRVTVLELAEFARKQVDRWVWANRGQRQEPRLFGKAKDFPVVQLGGEPPSMPEAPKEKSYPAWLKAGWKERDNLYQSGAYRLAPWPFRQLEQALLRSEKRWRSGADEDDSRIGPDLARTVANFKDAIMKANDSAAPRAFSLAEINDPKIEAFVKEFQPKFDRYLAKAPDPGAKIEEADKPRLEEVKKLKAEILDEMKKAPFDAGVSVIVASAARTPNLTPARILALVDLLGEISVTERRFSEMVYLIRLKDRISRVLDNGDWQGTTAHLALRIAIQSETVLALLGRTPAGFDPWNKTLLVRGETQRLRGDKDLFTGLDYSWREAQSAYLQAEQAFRPIPLRLDILRQMLEKRDHAFVRLPGWAPYLIAATRIEPREDAAWKGAMVAARGLADLLEAKDPITLDGEPTALIQWQNHAGQWRKAIDDRIARLVRLGDDGKPPEYHEWHALLESSQLKAEQRETMWLAARKLGLKLIQATPAPDATDAEVAALGIVPGDDPTARQENDRKERRVRLALEFLDLVAYAKLDALDAADPTSKDAKPLARRLQEALAQGVPSQFLGDALAKEKLADAFARADRLSRIYPDDLLKQAGGAGFNPAFRNPALALDRLNRETFWAFLRERYQREALDLRALNNRLDAFYADAADVYARTQP
ncbi:MAG: hypothetical protein WCL32_13880 [Planctomycetota bacterium]